MQNGTDTLEHSLTISCQVKYGPVIRHLDYYPNMVKIYIHKNLNTNV